MGVIIGAVGGLLVFGWFGTDVAGDLDIVQVLFLLASGSMLGAIAGDRVEAGLRDWLNSL